MTSATALILFAHGARDPEWAAPLRRVQAAITASAPERRVDLAFLEFMTPTLPECVAALAGAGVTSVVVVPMFIAQGGHLKRDLPALLDTLREQYPGLALVLAPAIGESAGVIAAMAQAALSAAD
ncbi:MAG: CbiX/SirB N-terminal domain-containing protein [Rhodocyclaceae bacterium]